jgi:hypothetical protein
MHFFEAAPFLFRFIATGIAYFGIAYVFYGLISVWTGEPWPFVERHGERIASIVTVFGVLLTALSIYFEAEKPHPAEILSRYITGPILIAICFIVLLCLVLRRSVGPSIINGLAMIGIGVALLRIQPNPYFPG